jgi:hypothetical protein
MLPLDHEHLFAVNQKSERLFVHAGTVRKRCDNPLNWGFRAPDALPWLGCPK